jgi:hypothetical protein
MLMFLQHLVSILRGTPYMVDKAGLLELERSRQAGVDDLKTYFPDLSVPEGLTLADLEAAEQMVFDWEDGDEEDKPRYRAIVLVIKVFEHFMGALRAAGKVHLESS